MWTLIVATFVAGTLATFTDWLFMGVLFHDRYLLHPEVWRDRHQGIGKSAILLSSALDYVAAGAIIALCDNLYIFDLESTLLVAVLAWIAGPLVVVVTNGFFVKFDPWVSATHAAGYLARFVIAGVAAAIVLPT